jgi:high-affinity iron transporter
MAGRNGDDQPLHAAIANDLQPGRLASSNSTSWDLVAGSLLGLVLGCGVTAVTYLGLVTIPTRRLFAVTTLLITFLASGLAAQAVLFLQQAGIVTALGQTAWDTSDIVSDTSLFGRVLHTLIGYADQPSVLQVVVYAVTLLTILALTKLMAPRPPGLAAGKAVAAR